MKKYSCLILGLLCPYFACLILAQGPSAPSNVLVRVAPVTVPVNPDTSLFTLAFPLVESGGDTVNIQHSVDIDLIVDLASLSNVDKVHLQVWGDIGGMMGPLLITSFEPGGPATLYGSTQVNGNQVAIRLVQDTFSEVTYSVWLEDDQGNLSTQTAASHLELIQ